eukprot:scaffold1809_cov386-Prasinococcus_capsulatus_cf.AAC.13
MCSQAQVLSSGLVGVEVFLRAVREVLATEVTPEDKIRFFDVYELSSQWQSQIPGAHWTPRLATWAIQMLAHSIIGEARAPTAEATSCPPGIHFRTYQSDCQGMEAYQHSPGRPGAH